AALCGPNSDANSEHVMERSRPLIARRIAHEPKPKCARTRTHCYQLPSICAWGRAETRAVRRQEVLQGHVHVHHPIDLKVKRTVPLKALWEDGKLFVLCFSIF
ncbi:uncharacterized, partial [Tachysurus ichikawai]